MIPQPHGKRYQISFDGASYAVAIDELKGQFRRLNRANEIYADLSKELGEHIDTLDTLEAILRLRTGFKNLDMASDALGVKDAYIGLKQLLSHGIPSPAIVTTKNGKAVPKEAYLDKLKEQYHTYLPVDQRKTYDLLEKACELINGCHIMERIAVVRMPDGTFTVNIHRLAEAKKYQD